MRKTKWMAAVLSVCLILVMLPTVAFAEGHAKSTGNAEHDNPFGDIHEGDYYYDAVLWAVEQGITSGTSATTFSPDTSCTRSQMVTFLWRSAGSPHAQYTVSLLRMSVLIPTIMKRLSGLLSRGSLLEPVPQHSVQIPRLPAPRPLRSSFGLWRLPLLRSQLLFRTYRQMPITLPLYPGRRNKE